MIAISKYSALITILLCSLYASLMPAMESQGLNADIKNVFDSFKACIQAKDAQKIMQLYDQSDSEFFKRTANYYKNIMTLPDLKYDHYLSNIKSLDDNSVEVVMFQKITCYFYNRSFTDASWRTFTVHKRKDGWKITAEEERNYAQPEYTDLNIELFPEKGTMQGKALIKMKIIEPGENNVLLKLNRGLKISSVTGNDEKELKYLQEDDALIIPWNSIFEGNEPLTITIHFSGTLYNESKERGYSQVNIGPQGSFASWVTNWYPRMWGNFSKSTGKITYLVPKGLTVASSGRLINKEAVGEKERHIFEVKVPMDFSFAAAQYFHHIEKVDDIAIGVYFLKGGMAKTKLYLENCTRIIKYLKNIYGMYPFDSYSIVEIPSDVTGNLGGSSEQGMNFYPDGILADDSFNLPLFAHEIGHSWWGNYVLSADGAIIDEGLAQMTAVLCIEKFQGENAMHDFLKNGTPDYPQSTRLFFQDFGNIVEKDIAPGMPQSGKEQILHQLADVKGHFIYNMLRETIGHKDFKEGLQSAIKNYAFKRMKLSDLRKEWEKASGKDLKWFFDQWFYRRSAPEFILHYTTKKVGTTYSIKGTIEQVRNIYRVEAEIGIIGTDGEELKRPKVKIAERETPFNFVIAAVPYEVIFDPDYKIFRWTEEFRIFAILGEGIYLRINNKNDEAIEKLSLFLNEMPDHLEGHYQIARAYQNLQKLSETIHHYSQVVQLYQKSKNYHWSVPWSYLRLGQIYDMKGLREEATKSYREVLSFPNVSNSHKEAKKYLETPFEQKER
jgi:tetratricopeptide (TPR) repeat protein